MGRAVALEACQEKRSVVSLRVRRSARKSRWMMLKESGEAVFVGGMVRVIRFPVEAKQSVRQTLIGERRKGQGTGACRITGR